jgi:hypothetical protein
VIEATSDTADKVAIVPHKHHKKVVAAVVN